MGRAKHSDIKTLGLPDNISPECFAPTADFQKFRDVGVKHLRQDLLGKPEYLSAYPSPSLHLD
ncbi:MAG TPA: hypothetical protein DEG17_09750 [Cyanobacteria bacterium UBA11149]|nr:hypothetical protein [Cyanobacteria bacterium UBA11166]HBR75713.1 hypothetical protein [Cyanobacteria bacterium UBA11159]HBW89131.1 hypothetical protein [Cyanobacteria bacterium UBA11149]HCA93482.1 hypothetical protein [Cyanobacteria bacterium UBA9226]